MAWCCVDCAGKRGCHAHSDAVAAVDECATSEDEE